MKKICVVGAFDFTRQDTGGQPVKTRELYDGLCRHYGADKILYVETRQWKKHIFRMLWQLVKNVPRSDVVIMLPAHNGVKVFSRLLQILKKKKAKLFYDVIGGWLPMVAEKDAGLLKNLKKIDGIWVETATMQRNLQALGLEQVIVIPNFKNLPVLEADALVYATQTPYRLCTFSRVMEEKGITDAAVAVQQANTYLGQKTFVLDVYGPVAPQYGETFAELQEKYADFLTYKGVADPADSVMILKDYFALLFPTYYQGEGFAGTLLDAMASGTPIIASDWRYNGEIVKVGYTGELFPTKDVNALVDVLVHTAQDVAKWQAMRKNCLCEAQQYRPDVVIERICKLIEV